MLFFNLTLDGGSSSSNNKIAIIMTANTYSSVCSMQESRHSTYINSFDPLSLLGIYCYYPWFSNAKTEAQREFLPQDCQVEKYGFEEGYGCTFFKSTEKLWENHNGYSYTPHLDWPVVNILPHLIFFSFHIAIFFFVNHLDFLRTRALSLTTTREDPTQEM